MKLENKLYQETKEKLEAAKKSAPTPSEKNEFFKREANLVSNFINEELPLEQFKEALRVLGETNGIAKFNTLPEFITAVRQLKISKENQDLILDHENAHALEALNRGYSFSYEIHYTKEKRKYFIIIVNIWNPIAASVKLDYFNKNNAPPTEHELRTDIVAVITAPERLTDGEMSELDKLMLGKH
jgi:hypothetical protein